MIRRGGKFWLATLLKIQQIGEQRIAGTTWLTAHSRVEVSTIPIIRAGLVGEKVRREKPLDSGCDAQYFPPACARFLIGGTCDKALAVSDSYPRKPQPVGRRVVIFAERERPLLNHDPRKINCFFPRRD